MKPTTVEHRDAHLQSRYQVRRGQKWIPVVLEEIQDAGAYRVIPVGGGPEFLARTLYYLHALQGAS